MFAVFFWHENGGNTWDQVCWDLASDKPTASSTYSSTLSFQKISATNFRSENGIRT